MLKLRGLNIKKVLEDIVKKAEVDEDVLAVMLFGSYAKGEPARDVDVCLVLFPTKASKGFNKRIEYSGVENLDISIFQDLPLYVRPRVIKEGVVLHCKDEDRLYDIAIRTAKEFELFRTKYELYLEGIIDG